MCFCLFGCWVFFFYGGGGEAWEETDEYMSNQASKQECDREREANGPADSDRKKKKKRNQRSVISFASCLKNLGYRT